MKKLLNKHSVFILTFPYVILFILFIVLPVAASVFLSFTQFNTIEFPKWIGLKNYMQLFTNDQIFMQKVLPNTIVYSLFVGIGGYILGFLIGAPVCGYIARGFKNSARPNIWRMLAGAFSALAICYTVGVMYMYLMLNFYVGSPMSMAKAWMVGCAVFLPTDATWCVLCSFVTFAVFKRINPVPYSRKYSDEYVREIG